MNAKQANTVRLAMRRQRGFGCFWLFVPGRCKRLEREASSEELDLPTEGGIALLIRLSAVVGRFATCVTGGL